MSEFDDLVADLKQKRDELRLKMHLASKEAQDEWEELEEKMQEFSSRAELGKTSEGLGDALGKLGEELKMGYKRVRDAIKED
jgi:vacuolar-type H+-ATPase subunit D/Vma8